MPLRARKTPVVLPLDLQVIKTVPMAFQQQQQSNWCWAACEAMVFSWNNFQISQCQIVGDRAFDKKNCCKNPQDCDVTRTDQQISSDYSAWEYQYTYTAAQISINSIGNTIDVYSLVEVGFSWNGGGGHVAIVNGVNTDSNTVFVSDPGNDAPMGWINYASLQSAYGQGTWDATWNGLAS
jgi:papain like cysteine protease AvrRpt2